MFPFPSSNVQVIVCDVYIGNTVLCVPTIVPAQLSVAVGGVKLINEHSAVAVASDALSATGAVISSITTLCVCVDVFPLPSSYVHVIVAELVIGKLALCVPMIVPAQLSAAVGAVKATIEH